MHYPERIPLHEVVKTSKELFGVSVGFHNKKAKDSRTLFPKKLRYVLLDKLLLGSVEI